MDAPPRDAAIIALYVQRDVAVGIDHFPLHDGSMEGNRFIEIEFRPKRVVCTNDRRGDEPRGGDRYNRGERGRIIPHGIPQG